MTDISDELKRCFDASCVFKLVKRAVREELGRSRGGLMLGLQDLPHNLLAYHVMGGNFIVVNKSVLRQVEGEARSRLEVNSYLFYILLHEYLHSLGQMNEVNVRAMVGEVSRRLLGRDHICTRIAVDGLASVFPGIPWPDYGSLFHPPTGIEIVPDFDRESISYIT
ncbi:MAG: hypothetical protein GTN80_07835 [Nitrososphaeria archaeon]|nr:hypothetical protein [Nitrososphaeria archaeon]NIN52974.1 hypothetical protein [Nitrososphaeria archaeon]NIQ33533.1 hypothetical protein [Nitrososphaeria archaeon]